MLLGLVNWGEINGRLYSGYATNFKLESLPFMEDRAAEGQTNLNRQNNHCATSEFFETVKWMLRILLDKILICT